MFSLHLIPLPIRHCGVGDKKVVNQWAFSGEKLIHGTPSGIDNAVATYGNILLYKDGRITTHDSLVNLDILLVNTHVPRSTKVIRESMSMVDKHVDELGLSLARLLAIRICLIFNQLFVSLSSQSELLARLLAPLICFCPTNCALSFCNQS